MISAESSGKQVDICYVGDCAIAQDAFSDMLSFSILNVSIDGKLNVEVYSVVEDKTTNGTIPVCEEQDSRDGQASLAHQG